MTRDLTLDDVIVAGTALVVGIVVAIVLRFSLGWIARHTTRTVNRTDDFVIGGLRILVPWAVFVAGAWAAVAAIPLTTARRTFADHLLQALLLIVVSWVAARVAGQFVGWLTLSRAGVAGSASIFVNIVRGIILAVGFLVLLQTLGVSVTPLLTALGVGGLAVALALQDTLSNLFAGVHILASRKVQPGDFIQLSSGQEGYVVDINWRNTVLRQLNNNLVVVPNAELASAILTNFYQPEREMSVLIEVGVSYASDLNKVERVTCEVAAEVMREVEGAVATHEPFIRFHTFNESSIDFSVILRGKEFTDQYLIKHEFIKRLHDRYRRESIEIPFPMRTVVLAGANGDGPAEGTSRTDSSAASASAREEPIVTRPADGPPVPVPAGDDAGHQGGHVEGRPAA